MKVAVFAFNGEPMCFVHALLYAEDLHTKGHDVKLIIEGSATKLVKELADPEVQFHSLYMKVKELGVIDCVCMACSKKMGAYDSAVEQGLPICGEMKGHPSLLKYVEAGYETIAL
ncbi:MAG: cytoplasmic protein [Candidatus Bathyarchaeota archaeon]|nr:cytoplasmic protein [Candidatus Bathyarchaeota archaeon]